MGIYFVTDLLLFDSHFYLMRNILADVLFNVDIIESHTHKIFLSGRHFYVSSVARLL